MASTDIGDRRMCPCQKAATAAATQSVVNKSDDTTCAAPAMTGDVAKTSPAQSPAFGPQMEVPASQMAPADRTMASTR